MSRPFFGLVIGTVLIVAGCRTPRDEQVDRSSALPPIQPTILQYVDTDAFDALFEASLKNHDPAIIVRTAHEKPDWEGRLNAWIAAWNRGGKGERRIIRGQIPLPVQTIDADLVREFRLLIFGLVDRAEDLAKGGSAWWQEERMRSHRVALLRRYNLRFHMGEDKRIQLIFFHGDHARRYAEFMKGLIGAEDGEWSREIECSICTKLQEEARTRPMPKAAD